MNERIKQLAKDSDLIRYDSDGNIAQVEKFAESIIRECADVAFLGFAGPLEDSEQVRDVIIKHFGVKE